MMLGEESRGLRSEEIRISIPPECCCCCYVLNLHQTSFFFFLNYGVSLDLCCASPPLLLLPSLPLDVSIPLQTGLSSFALAEVLFQAPGDSGVVFSGKKCVAPSLCPTFSGQV